MVQLKQRADVALGMAEFPIATLQQDGKFAMMEHIALLALAPIFRQKLQRQQKTQ